MMNLLERKTIWQYGRTALKKRYKKAHKKKKNLNFKEYAPGPPSLSLSAISSTPLI